MMAALNAYHETHFLVINRPAAVRRIRADYLGRPGVSDMTPRQFKAIFVDDNVDEFLAAPHDVVRAVNAIWAVDALVAHIWLWGSENTPDLVPEVSDDKYRDMLCDKCKPYAALRDAANAMKHAKLTRRRPVIHYSTDVRRTGGESQSVGVPLPNRGCPYG